MPQSTLTLNEKCMILVSELGLKSKSESARDVVDEACRQMGIHIVDGSSIVERADICLTELLGEAGGDNDDDSTAALHVEALHVENKMTVEELETELLSFRWQLGSAKHQATTFVDNKIKKMAFLAHLGFGTWKVSKSPTITQLTVDLHGFDGSDCQVQFMRIEIDDSLSYVPFSGDENFNKNGEWTISKVGSLLPTDYEAMENMEERLLSEKWGFGINADGLSDFNSGIWTFSSDFRASCLSLPMFAGEKICWAILPPALEIAERPEGEVYLALYLENESRETPHLRAQVMFFTFLPPYNSTGTRIIVGGAPSFEGNFSFRTKDVFDEALVHELVNGKFNAGDASKGRESYKAHPWTFDGVTKTFVNSNDESCGVWALKDYSQVLRLEWPSDGQWAELGRQFHPDMNSRKDKWRVVRASAESFLSPSWTLRVREEGEFPGKLYPEDLSGCYFCMYLLPICTCSWFGPSPDSGNVNHDDMMGRKTSVWYGFCLCNLETHNNVEPLTRIPGTNQFSVHAGSSKTLSFSSCCCMQHCWIVDATSLAAVGVFCRR